MTWTENATDAKQTSAENRAYLCDLLRLRQDKRVWAAIQRNVAERAKEE